MTRSQSSSGSKATQVAKNLPAASSVDSGLVLPQKGNGKEAVRSYQQAVAALERFTVTLPTLATIVTTVDPRRREDLSRVLAEGERLAKEAQCEREMFQRSSRSKPLPAEVLNANRKARELEKRILDFSERTEQLFDAGRSIPANPGIISSCDEKVLCEVMAQHRHRFWTALHMVPFVREHTLQELERVRQSGLKASLTIFTKRSEHKSEAKLNRHVDLNARTVRGMLERADWKPGLLNSAKIATLLIEVPLLAEKQNMLMADLSNRTRELRTFHDQLAQRYDSVDSLTAKEDPYYELYLARMRELGGSVDHAEIQCRVLEALREPYQRIKEYLVNSNIRLVGKIVSSKERVMEHQKELMQDGVIGLMRAVEKFDPTTGFKLSTIATWWILQAVLRNRSTYYNLIALPPNQFKALGMINKADMHRPPLNDDQLAEKLHIKREVVTALRIRLRGVKSFTPTNDEAVAEGERLEDFRGEPVSEIVERRELNERIRQMLVRIESRSAEILRLRFGLGCETKTLGQIAQLFGLTRERIRQLEAKALNKIRTGHLGKMLDDFVA